MNKQAVLRGIPEHCSYTKLHSAPEYIILIMCVCPECINLVCPAVKHSLKLFLTGSTGFPSFPDFMAAVLVDDIVVGYCDTNRKIVEPKQDWVKTLFEDEPQHLEMFTQQCVEGTAIYFKNTIDNLKQQYNQSEGKYINYI